MERQNEDVFNKLRAALPELRPRPNTGRLWLDIVFLLLVASLQFTILPSIFGSYLIVDIITPWLVISFVHQRLPQATVLAFVGALTLESHSAIPAGLYVCAYWIMVNVIVQVRPTLSWRHRIPWIVIFGIAALWIIVFESFVLAFATGVHGLNLYYWPVQMLRIAIAVGFGIYLCREWLEIDAEEPVPS